MPVEQPGEGGGASAPVRTAFPGRPVTELVGGTTTRKMIECGYYTVPSDVYFQFRVAAGVTNATTILNIARGFSGEIEAVIAANPAIASISYIQDTNKADQLVDTMDVEVEGPGGEGSRDFTVSLYRFTVENVTPLVNAALAEMAALTVTQ